jgi:peptide/nickel transport system ATP-binding protein
MLDAEPMEDGTAPSATRPLLDVRNLRKYFPILGGLLSRPVAALKTIDGVSFSISTGEVVGLVGESGSGKTTVGRTILRLQRPTSGEILFDGVDLAPLSVEQMRPYRKQMQLIFQDPYASLNPRMIVGRIIGEALSTHGLAPGRARPERIAELLHSVGLRADHMRRYPHEFSGGQRQRIGIARALAVDPRFIVGDEPVSALDVSIQAQVVNLLDDLKERLGLTMLFKPGRSVHREPWKWRASRSVPCRDPGHGRKRTAEALRIRHELGCERVREGWF